jgi:hypothetical protein
MADLPVVSRVADRGSFCGMSAPPPLVLCDGEAAAPPVRAWLDLRELLTRLPRGAARPPLPRCPPRPARCRRRWLEAEERRAAAAWRAGDDPGEIALALGRSQTAVTTRLGRLGLLRSQP